MQLTAKHKGGHAGELEAGDEVIILRRFDDGRQQKYPAAGVAKPYLRIVPAK